MAETTPAPVHGATLMAQTLRHLGVTTVFGIVGIPVVEVADACIAEGIRFIGFRNEQAASYAAGAWGFLTGQPGVCLVVSGPGVLHAIPGLANAQANAWPMVLLGGSSPTSERGRGAFQEWAQVEAVRPYTKYAAQPANLDRVPTMFQAAFRYAINGRPGACYVDLPADLIQGAMSLGAEGTAEPIMTALQGLSPPTRTLTLADPVQINRAVESLRRAQAPLVIVGKGAAYARGETALTAFIDRTGFPFLPTSMGKGVLSDTHPLCVGAARSEALKDADVILLLGARLNWLLHFGERFSSTATIIQVDVQAEELGHNRTVDIPLAGDVAAVLGQISSAWQSSPSKGGQDFGLYLDGLRARRERNHATLVRKADSSALPMTYHRAFRAIREALDDVYDRVVLVSEGANTMDIARSMFDLHSPRRRLDAGTLATMGVGMGLAIAAQVHYGLDVPNEGRLAGQPPSPHQHHDRAVAIVGDSAFGFSAMEIETAARTHLPLIVIVVNNNGIYHGFSDDEYRSRAAAHNLPSTALSPGTRYDLLGEALGAQGFHATTPEALHAAVRQAWDTTTRPSVINCCIEPGGQQKLVSV
ncbi:hypothetical protein IWQ60_012269 [Tieghemiomyces parasiticus]|uniref:2-hydroxyacyl-CoA lyase n=1 Tax=Tieghemiomyces parasiticus TaxID=78921 RepID=A0A9W7ZI74_9FUNG|nr:hypothetical protein IWQ60_012269 [Tieghemiomyces parasiticus]